MKKFEYQPVENNYTVDTPSTTLEFIEPDLVLVHHDHYVDQVQLPEGVGLCRKVETKPQAWVVVRDYEGKRMVLGRRQTWTEWGNWTDDPKERRMYSTHLRARIAARQFDKLFYEDYTWSGYNAVAIPIHELESYLKGKQE